MTMATLTGLVIYTYRIGFGDCFLLRFEYADRPRHVLVDFGTSASPERLESQVPLVAAHVAETCGGRLDAIVATHRHSDHVSGFAGASWKVLARLKPALVVLPWTEHPDAATDATVAPSGSRGRIGARSAAHARSLDAMHEVAAAALQELRRRGPGGDGDDDDGAPDEPDLLGPWAARDLGPAPVGAPWGRRLAAELRLVGGVNLKNREAMENLLSLPAQDFVCYGSRTRLSDLLPGVRIRVLGPPTLAQSAAIRDQREEDRAEYWHVMAAAGRASARAGGAPLFPGARTVQPDALPLETRWFLGRVDAVRAQELLQIVRSLDGVLNNTSVILLLEVGGPRRRKRLLFPGDAQLEDWSYALAQPGIRELLRDVDVYKVGHHGSLNATPKSIWGAFRRRGPEGTPGRLKTLLSTRRNKHGRRENGTEVPRGPLLEELQARSDLTSTLDMKGARDLVREERIL